MCPQINNETTTSSSSILDSSPVFSYSQTVRENALKATDVLCHSFNLHSSVFMLLTSVLLDQCAISCDFIIYPLPASHTHFCLVRGGCKCRLALLLNMLANRSKREAKKQNKSRRKDRRSANSITWAVPKIQKPDNKARLESRISRHKRLNKSGKYTLSLTSQ